MPSLRIALAQIDTTVGDLTNNAAAIQQWCRQAGDLGADVAVFPEMALTGYPIEDLALRRSFQRSAAMAADELAHSLAINGLGELVVIVGSIGPAAPNDTKTLSRPSNRALVLHQGRVIAAYDKHHLPNYGVFDEFRIFAPGSTPTIVEVRERRLGLAICEDIWQDGGTTQALSTEAIDALVVLNGSPYEQGKGHTRTELVRQRARQLSAPVCYVNLVGGQDDLVFDGGSFVVDAAGTELLRLPQFVEGLDVVDLPEAGSQPKPGRIAPPLSTAEEVYRAATLGLQDYARKTGFTSVVLGLSGGIDSALVAAMAADALGGENVVGVSMPSDYSSQHSKDDAADLAARIDADYRVVPIAPMVQSFHDQLTLEGVAAENLQARVRGMVLMSLSNAEGHLCLATGNKSELAAGYSTIYGDAVGGYAPLKDIDKSLVWELARWRNNDAIDRGQIPPIPENSITKPPSAELRPGQVDQDSLPPYHVLDEVLGAYIEHAEGRAELLQRGFDPEIVDKVVTLVDRAEWKRRQYPLGPKVTALAFGRDRRLPITSRWREPRSMT
ncbi:NAD+ synthase (glutamine-hydrolysing) [Micrococcales bacterium KH10]|nr:NAD+ synthase (glutamine-hydrolysing) [Micrococcales bacterium KH10]